jgi:hypothetical protein
LGGRSEVDRPCLLVVAPPVLVLKIGATGRLDAVRVCFGVDGPRIASLQPASICWLINRSDTCREHIGLWFKKGQRLRTTKSRKHQKREAGLTK